MAYGMCPCPHILVITTPSPVTSFIAKRYLFPKKRHENVLFVLKKDLDIAQRGGYIQY